MKRWMASLHARLMLSLGFGWVILVSVLLATSWYLGRDLTRQTLLVQLEYQAEMLARTIEQDIQSRRQALIRLASALDKQTIQEPQQLSQLLAANDALLASFDSLVFANAQGLLVADWPQAEERNNLDVTERSFFVRAQQSQRPFTSDPFLGRVTTEPLIMQVVPLHSAQGEFLGMLGGVQRVLDAGFLGFLQQHRLGLRGFAGIGTADGVVLVHPDPEFILYQLSEDGANPLIGKALLGWEGSGAAELMLGGRALQAYKQVWIADWIIAVYLPEEEAYAAFDDLLWSLWFLGGVLIALSLPVLWWLLWLLLLPVQRFATQIEAITRGEQDRLAEQSSLTELRSVARRFNALLASQAKNQATLQQRQAYLHAVLDSSPTGLFLADLDGKTIYVNLAYQEMLGLNKQALLGWQWLEEAVAPQDQQALLSAWQAAVAEGQDFRCLYRATTSDGNQIWLDAHASAITSSSGEAQGYIGTLRDVTEQKNQEEQALWQAKHDGLTQLLNRRGFDEAIEAVFSQRHQPETQAQLLLIDLDHFKPINDQLGHPVGDLWLQAIARILQEIAKGKGEAARQGGDEFALLLKLSAAEATELAEQVRQTLAELTLDASPGYQVTASIGIAGLSAEDSRRESWVKRADEACYAAKAGGRNQVVSFSELSASR